ncbi:homeobox-leucine zipper protein ANTHOCYANINLESS 2 [Pyrus ussuriensis x Pyrus communis]|uniref:Homeobox-leucine zipper protein ANTHOCYANINLESS 2 n=1 Tax=Pyrus ussuriensis x Pyrus communis TaxID=2448454 RepID=A0A5N5FDW5_9ROSA|nr:homeobox-leucine zipper protein ANTHOCYANINLESS 2 [Pyrus ussuriensis x Pyrus communis]
MSLGGLISSSGGGNSGGGRGRVVAEIAPHAPSFMPSGTIAHPHFLSSPIPNPMQTSSSALSLSIQKMDGHSELGFAENFDPGIIGRLRDDEHESKSGSDNFEGASGDDQDGGGGDQPPRKKKYHRHTPNQIQELENFFKECPHPDEKQRSELSRRLGLESKQVKFWFQNRRTQMKTQLERHENIILRQENDKLIAENGLMKDAISNPVCNNCGGPAIPGQISFDGHQLRIENARLKEELNRICAMANKLPISSLGIPGSILNATSGLELGVGRNGMDGMNAVSAGLPMGFDLGDGISSSSPMIPPVKTSSGMMGNEVPFERSMYIDLALAAMDELVKMVQVDSPLWIKSSDGTDILNIEEYQAFSCIGMKPSSLVTEATRDTCVVIVNSLALVETLMDANRWAEMFQCLVARASTIDMISNGMDGTRNGALQLMYAELQMLSPLVPVRPLKFLRFCKQHAEGVWAVVDVSIDINQEGPNTNPFVDCRRLPSGCVVQDMPNNCSKVTWIEHTEYDENIVHHLFRETLRSGMGFGAQRWLATLQRQGESLAFLISSANSNEDLSGIDVSGKKSMLKLAQRMVDNFCAGISASSVRKWDKLCFENVSEDVRVMARKSMNDPGEPPGIVLSVATTVWVPVSRHRVFEFLRDEQFRKDWDILSSGVPMQRIVQIGKGQGDANGVSLLRANAPNANNSNMLILQETWTDPTGSLVVYAPVDTESINVVMRGGDSAYVALLPSGFAILPGGPPGYGVVKSEGKGYDGSGGCLLTVAFQILVSSLPTAKINMESVETVSTLISCTIQRIKSALLAA